MYGEVRLAQHNETNEGQLGMRLPCVVINEKYPPICVNPLLPTLWQGTKVILVPSEKLF